MITLEQKLEQYKHTYVQLKGELKWKTSDSRTGMMIPLCMQVVINCLISNVFRN